ncbi:Serine/threonine protein kinase [Candidatus Sulfopaludibacter sp. SbA4]|nr:Serine/threonine protein kinase [Candidatus Sulfopaludibacter sp. SbA4]
MIGRTLAHYQVLDTLGQGGMGVVYKARDTQLDRFVAIKVLTPDKVRNAERKLRFVQEARTVSALNHPNIVTIYDIGSEDGVDFIVMEFVAGHTLDKLTPRGGLKLADLLKYAIPVADALACAHAAGIVHRDLKPGNIMVAGPESGYPGQVKLLDFGLAKLSELHDASDAELTRSEGPETEEGSILGTVSYMSPEQAEARKVDARSDIFSFGAVLYEMATGKRAFLGRSKISTLAAVLNSDPQRPAGLHPGLPRDLEKIIQRCLRKDPAWRYQSAADLKISLYDLQHDTEPDVSAPPPAPPGISHDLARSLLWVGMLALGLALGASGAWWLAPRGGGATSIRGAVKPLTTYAGNEYEPALSPDGNQIAFAWNGRGKDNYDIYVRLVDGGAPLRLTTDPLDDRAPAWSPDSRSLAFLRGNAIYLIPALGGVERKLLEFPHGSLLPNNAPSQLSWSPDGKFLAFSGTEDAGACSIWIVSIDSGERHRASTLPKGYFYEVSPAFSPDGRTLAFIRARDWYSRTVVFQAVNADGTIRGPEREVTGYDRAIQDLVWQPDSRGLILSVRQGGNRTGLYRLIPGAPLQPLGFDSSFVRWPSLSRTGNRLAYEKRRLDTNIYRMDGPGPDGGPRPYDQCHETIVIDSTLDDREPGLSPDGRRLVFNSDRSGFFEIHVADADGANQVALTTMGPAAVGSPRWSPDGQTIVFDRYEDGHSRIYTVPAGGGKPRRMTGDESPNIRPSFSRDGRWIYFSSNRSGRNEIWKIPAGGGPAQQLTSNFGNEPFESPDGKLLYYTNPQGLWSLPLAGGDPKLVVPGAEMFLYALAGHSVYYGLQNPQRIMVLRLDTGRTFEYVQFPKRATWFDLGTAFTVSADERTILFAQTDRQESDLMLMEDFK